MSGRIRVLVVEDSLTVRRRLCDVLASDASLQVIGEAADGERAIELCQELRPDVITMDMMLPGLTGLAATEHIMAHFPTPILIVSASTNRGELFETYHALAAGAVDVLEKPLGDERDDDWERRLIETVKLVSRIRVITHPRARLGGYSRHPSSGEIRAVEAPRPTQLIAIGASTGGPAAIVQVLRALPADFRIPIALVLHIGEQFAAAFGEWLDQQCALDVVYASDGRALASCRGVVMAPPEQHLTIERGRFRLDSSPARHSCRPSVDVLFESLARECGPAAMACLLTGMGVDGARGMKLVRDAGGRTIAQDEATSVVYGMPREALRLGGAERVLPIGAIGPALAALGGRGEP